MTEAILLCRCFSMCLHTLRAVRVWPHAFERIKSGECACICLRVCIVWHLSAFIESWWSIFKCWPVSRAERVYTCFCIYRELDMCVHLLVRIWGWRGDHHVWASIKSWASMCMSQRLWRCCYDSSAASVCIESWACICMCFSRFESLQVTSLARIKRTNTSWKVDSAVVEGSTPQSLEQGMQLHVHVTKSWLLLHWMVHIEGFVCSFMYKCQVGIFTCYHI
jgi:hypothetical protein